jgi:hypothetical protein
MVMWLRAFALMLAFGSEQRDLATCFKAIEKLSEGPGDVLVSWNKQGLERREAIFVSAERRKVEGFYAYTDEGIFHHFLPAKERGEYYAIYPFDLSVSPDRSYRCTYRRIKLAVSRPGFDCRVEMGNPKYAEVDPAPLSGKAATEWPLKAAILQRIGSMAPLFKKEVEKYRKDLEEHIADSRNPGFGRSFMAQYLGWKFGPPAEPKKDGLLKALESCTSIDDEAVRLPARSALNAIAATRIPRVDLVTGECK